MKRKINLKISDINDIENIEAIHYDTVKKVGNGAMVRTYKKYLGREAIVIILMEDPRQKRVVSKKAIEEMKKDKENFYT